MSQSDWPICRSPTAIRVQPDVNVSRNVSLAEGICLLDVDILLKYQLWVVLRGL